MGRHMTVFRYFHLHFRLLPARVFASLGTRHHALCPVPIFQEYNCTPATRLHLPHGNCSTSRFHTVLTVLGSSLVSSTGVNTVIRAQLYHQLGSQHRQGPDTGNTLQLLSTALSSAESDPTEHFPTGDLLLVCPEVKTCSFS